MALTSLAALVLIAASLSIPMAGAWLVQQRTGNSGWVDTIWTFSLGLVAAGSALWPVAGSPPNARQWLIAALVAVWSLRLGSHIAAGALRLQDYAGLLILLIGIAGEALADAQLKRFRDNPANSGRVCDAGLWRGSRHPNYFFEWFGWLAYPVVGLSADCPWGFATLLAPIFMYWILVHVTGIPPLEQQMLRSRGERYRDYQLRTSRFFPLPPQA
jgi:steroid 5-alpha reductase family enzyme